MATVQEILARIEREKNNTDTAETTAEPADLNLHEEHETPNLSWEDDTPDLSLDDDEGDDFSLSPQAPAREDNSPRLGFESDSWDDDGVMAVEDAEAPADEYSRNSDGRPLVAAAAYDFDEEEDEPSDEQGVAFAVSEEDGFDQAVGEDSQYDDYETSAAQEPSFDTYVPSEQDSEPLFTEDADSFNASAAFASEAEETPATGRDLDLRDQIRSVLAEELPKPANPHFALTAFGAVVCAPVGAFAVAQSAATVTNAYLGEPEKSESASSKALTLGVLSAVIGVVFWAVMAVYLFQPSLLDSAWDAIGLGD